MSKSTKILLLTVSVNVILSYILAVSIVGVPAPTFGDYFTVLLLSIVTVITPFIVGFITWMIFKHIHSSKPFYFIVFNLLVFLLLLFGNLKVIYDNWHYKKYQANIDYNESLTKQGGYLDTCMMLAQNDIKKSVSSANDFRILSYNYDEALNTVPRDSTNKYYLFEIIYSRNKNGAKTVRAARYLINFNQILLKLYDIDTKDPRAKKQIQSLKKAFQKLQNFAEKFPDSADNNFKTLKEKLKDLK